MRKITQLAAVLVVAAFLTVPVSAQTNPALTISANALSSWSNGNSGYLSAWYSPSGPGFMANRLLAANVTNPAYLLTLSMGGAATLSLPTAGTYAILPQLVGQTVTTPGTAVAAGTCQAQTGVGITGVATTSVCVASLNATPAATWQTGIFWITAASANTCTVYLCNGTAAIITPATATLNVRAIP